MADVVYVDVEDGSKRVMNNIKLFVKLLGKFKEDKSLDEINAALTAGDMAKAQIAAHTIKGLTANLSLMELNKQCIELEAQLKSGSIPNEQFAAVKDTYAKTIQEVDKVIAQYV
jgi:HPt (histidine-containing phosphotransfer) domain-containing protein